MLQGLQLKGYLISPQDGKSRRARRFYSATPKGITALSAAKKKVKELFGELFEVG
jgi:DNA-binding PadR family transcriptional regulator